MKYIDERFAALTTDKPVRRLSAISEIDRQVRIIEIFIDGFTRHASRITACNGARLDDGPIGDLHDIAARNHSIATEITAAEFETIWQRHMHVHFTTD